MSVSKFSVQQLSPVAFQTISLANSTAVGFNSTITGSTANVLHLSIETQIIRYRADGTDPTLNTGVAMAKDVDYWWWGMPDRENQTKFQRSTGTATISVMAYKHTGQP